MSTVKPLYAAATTLTCSIASKTSGQGRRSAAVTNSSNLYEDILLTYGVLIGTFTAPAYFIVWPYGSADDGSNFETGGSTDADYNTIRNDEGVPSMTKACYTNTTTFWGVGTVAYRWGGKMPRDWGALFSQLNCGTLSATEGNHTKKWQGFNRQIV